MPPKKPAASSIVGEYDIELMNEKELRMYIEALQEEQIRMRKARNLFLKDRNELLNILKATQENITNSKGMEIQKHLEIQELIIQEEQESKYEDMLNNIIELDIKNQEEKAATDSFINIKTAEIAIKDEEETLCKAIAEREREIENMAYTFKLMLIELKENSFEKCHKSTKNHKNDFEKFVNDYNENFIKSIERFSENKIEKLQANWGDIPDTENNPFADTVAKMGAYFKDIFWKNIKTIGELQLILVDLKRNLNTVTLHLRDISEKNKELKTGVYKPISPLPSSEIPAPSFSIEKTKNFEELTYENYLLNIKLEMLNKEHNDLKKKFAIALRKIYQKADFKALLLEKKLSTLQASPERCH